MKKLLAHFLEEIRGPSFTQIHFPFAFRQGKGTK